jgi:hypothetical protein
MIRGAAGGAASDAIERRAGFEGRKTTAVLL